MNRLLPVKIKIVSSNLRRTERKTSVVDGIERIIFFDKGTRKREQTLRIDYMSMCMHIM